MDGAYHDFGINLMTLAFGAFTATTCGLYLYFCGSGHIAYEIQLVVLLCVLMVLSLFLAVDSAFHMITSR